jgi:hypothetical protein
MTTLLAGIMAGTLMGLVFITHVSLVLVFRPPAALARRAAERGVTALITTGTVAGLTLWTMLGVAAAFLFRAIENGYPSDIPSVPSLLYVLLVLFIAGFSAIPAALFLRDRLAHLAAEYALFVAIFGWLIPGLVQAI